MKAGALSSPGLVRIPYLLPPAAGSAGLIEATSKAGGAATACPACSVCDATVAAISGGAVAAGGLSLAGRCGLSAAWAGIGARMGLGGVRGAVCTGGVTKASKSGDLPTAHARAASAAITTARRALSRRVPVWRVLSNSMSTLLARLEVAATAAGEGLAPAHSSTMRVRHHA